MKFAIICIAWGALVTLPAAAIWGHVAGSIGLRLPWFLIPAVYGVIILQVAPWIVRWKWPQLFA